MAEIRNTEKNNHGCSGVVVSVDRIIGSFWKVVRVSVCHTCYGYGTYSDLIGKLVRLREVDFKFTDTTVFSRSGHTRVRPSDLYDLEYKKKEDIPSFFREPEPLLSVASQEREPTTLKDLLQTARSAVAELRN